MIFRPIASLAVLGAAAFMLAACGPAAKVVAKIATKAATKAGGAANGASRAATAGAAVSHADEVAAGVGEAGHGRAIAQEAAGQAGQYYLSDNSH